VENVDVIVVGAGVVGLAIAAKMSQTFKNVIVIDKNSSFGEETSSRNSEVIHAGIYYPENTLKAKLCMQGKHDLYQYCQSRKIPFHQIGKLIVAQNTDEEAHLTQIQHSAFNNGVPDLTWLCQSELRDREPNLKASSALLSPSTGIIDSHSYMQSLIAQIQSNSGIFVGNTRINNAEPISSGFIVKLTCQKEIMTLKCRYLINSAGLNSEKVAHSIAGLQKSLIPKLHWCRGHYFSYSGKSPFNQLIYPIPEANTQGLGIHATLDLAYQLKFGPDTQYINTPNYQFGHNLKPKFIQAIQRYFPKINPQKLQPSYTGIRPKLQGPSDKFKDFNIQTSQEHKIPNLVNLYGIESPGLTASLAIGEYVSKALYID